MINYTSFTDVCRLFSDPRRVFVIPTFQRPYAWDDEQVNDLIDDISRNAARQNGYHYLSPIHLVKIDGPQDPKWSDYTDPANPDVTAITTTGFCDNQQLPFDVYFIIDGQQRSTALYALLYTLNPAWVQPIHCTDANGYRRDIPKLILNYPDDHNYFRHHIGLPNGAIGQPNSRSQRRLSGLFARLAGAGLAAYQGFIIRGRLVTLQIELHPIQGFQSFLAMNDRGKRLTAFEKLKALLMQYGWNFNCNPPDPATINNRFGAVYRALDHNQNILTDDHVIQILGMHVFLNQPVPNLPDYLWYGPEKMYDCFKCPPHGVAPCALPGCADLQAWVTSLGDVADQAIYLNQCLAGNYRGTALGAMPSMSARMNGAFLTVEDEYNILHRWLGLSVRTLALLMKFRSTYGVDWHSPTPLAQTLCVANGAIKNTLSQKISTLLDSGIPDTLRDIANSLKARVSALPDDACYDAITLHQMAEWIELFGLRAGRARPGSFVAAWNNAFANNGAGGLLAALQHWFWYAMGWGVRDGFFAHLIDGIGGAQDVRFKYVLAEYDVCRTKTKHIYDPIQNLEVEHMFAQDPAFAPANYGFGNNVNDYNQFIQKICNLTWLDHTCNVAASNRPPDIKAGIYAMVGNRHADCVSTSAQFIGHDWMAAGTPPPPTAYYKQYLELRNIEIALFALDRF